MVIHQLVDGSNCTPSCDSGGTPSCDSGGTFTNAHVPLTCNALVLSWLMRLSRAQRTELLHLGDDADVPIRGGNNWHTRQAGLLLQHPSTLGTMCCLYLCSEGTVTAGTEHVSTMHGYCWLHVLRCSAVNQGSTSSATLPSRAMLSG